jgi:hypothetical protein
MATVRTACCNKTALQFPRTAVLSPPYISGRSNAILLSNVTEKQFLYRPGQTPRFPRGLGSQICRLSAHEVGNIVSLCNDRPNPQRDISVSYVC